LRKETQETSPVGRKLLSRTDPVPS
jgi:hypothetical protein